MLYRTTLSSPLGDLTLVADDHALVAILWPDDPPARVRLGTMRDGADHPVLVAAARQMREYFAGTRTAFDLPLAPRGTDFQRAVWRALDAIPYGETRSYADIAQAIGRPAAVRLAILVDRGHRELPIRPDFVGKNLPSARSERVNVQLAEVDAFEAVTIGA